jgi:hypothetical protein
MSKAICIALVFFTIALALGADEINKPKGVFSSLKIGQSVTLKEEATGITISFFDEELPMTHTITETGDEFIVVRDIADVTETTIPVYSIKKIVKIRTKEVGR